MQALRLSGRKFSLLDLLALEPNVIEGQVVAPTIIF